ncbi:HYR domain-containing protein [Mariprofundus erugo]|uniref:HYR domain-containing protein n=1 Tax=Mariprofundus erugo TaxID=2528639 RepID=A0A5R9GMN5_9PROT|nr:HYR domain-containing protein [Mariprofundus erugo]TLS67300.1 HYR domain-containing protein [Mariprofundus erugo]
MKKLKLLFLGLLVLLGLAPQMASAAVGDITTVAGNGTLGSSGDGGAATAAQFGVPGNVVVDAAGNLYIADGWYKRVRKVDVSGNISSLMQGVYANDIAIDGAGNIYVANLYNQVQKMDAAGNVTTVAGTGVRGFSGDGGAAVSAQLNQPSGVAVDGAGNLYIADTGNHCIRKVDASGNISTVAGTGVLGYSGDGGAAVSAQLAYPNDVEVDGVGNLYIADTANQRIRKVDTSGKISTVAGTSVTGYSGDGGAATLAKIAGVYNIGIDSVGNIYLADSGNNRIRKVDVSGNISTVVGTGVAGFSGDGGPALSAQLNSPKTVYVDSAGNLYIGDGANLRVRKVAGVAAAAAAKAEPMAWGYNSYGVLATGDTKLNIKPLAVPQAADFVSIKLGISHGVGLKADGTVWAWGYNDYGQLGLGYWGGVSYTPVQVSGLTNVVAIDAGQSFTVALKADGTVWAWGINNYSQAGMAPSTAVPGPYQISGLTNVTAIAAGRAHAIALKSDGTVWSWGNNQYGQSGNGVVNGGWPFCITNPVQVSVSGAVSIAAGSSHNFALKSDGTVWAWGLDASGELGDGRTGVWAVPTPVQTQISGVASVSAGYNYASALKTDGTVWVWGLNRFGQAGNGTITPTEPLPVQTNITGVRQISAGSSHMLAVKLDGTVWSWGYGGFWQLGTGTSTTTPTPVQLSGLGGIGATVEAGSNESFVYGGVSGGAGSAPAAPANQPPVANAGAAQVVESAGAMTAVMLNGSASSDPDGDTLTYSWSWNGGSATGATPTVNLANGTYNISLTVDDGKGGTATATTTVTVRDTVAPSISIAPIAAVEATSVSGASVNVTSYVTTSDVCGVQLGVSPAGVYALGNTSVTVTATDCAGNSRSASTTVSVVDTTAPVLSVPANVSVEATARLTSVAIGAATATDIFAVTVSNNVPAAFPVGNTTVTWTATDANGNSATATQTVTVTDTTAPSVVAPAAVTVEATGALTAVTLGSASASDLVDGVVTATADQTGPFAPGVYTITWSATDAAGNTGTATQIVTVTDTTAPSVIAPAAVTVEATGALTAVTLGSATASDLVDGVVTATADQSGPFAPGVHTITWSATDAHGNVGTATQTVTVTDTTAPSVIAPAAVTVEATGALTAVTLGSATASDLVDGVVTATADQSGPFAPGVYTITWRATDAAGNTGKATQTVTVTDTTAPSVVAPAAVTVEATAALTAVTLGSATASDLVDGVVTATADQTGPFAPGVYTITWSATDAAGNTGTATQTVTVTDTTAPSVIAPAAVTVEATGALTAVTLGSASASDLVDGVVTAIADQTGPFAPGVYTITWSATDAHGNVGTATQTVTVTDTTAPSVLAPADVTVEASAVLSTVAIGNATATDLVDGAVAASSNAPASFPVGTTVVIWSATDAAGNTGSATQKVTVVDTTAPVLTLPANVTAEANGNPGSTVAIGNATATDIFPVTVTSNAPAVFPLGVTSVIWSATDANGNVSTATQTVTVVDTTAPAMTLPADVHVEATAALSSVVIGTATATDLFGPVSVVSDAPASFALGTTVVTWTATDANGNSSTGTQRVTVVDTTAPAVAAALEAVKVEGQEGVFRVVFSSHDLVDANPALSAMLNGVTVSNGQSVHLSYGSRQKVEGGRNVEIEAPSFSLDVISTDASGNAGSAAAAYAFPAPREAHGDSKSDHGKQSESKSKSKSSKRD